jgi:CheY-like chemotaxis protein
MTLPEILLIEDSNDDRELFTAAVERSGLQARVVHAEDAAHAVLRLNRRGRYEGVPLPALIVLDLNLPGFNGRALIHVIRRAYGAREIPIVVLTGSRRPEDHALCKEWGANEFLAKSEDPSGLLELVRSLGRYLPGSRRSGGLPDDLAETGNDSGTVG